MSELRHVSKALDMMDISDELSDFIHVYNPLDEKGVASVVKFQIQSDPIPQVGVNGVQASDMIEYVKCLFKSLDNSYPCEENKRTISHLEEAQMWQVKRTKDRNSRGVEGKNEK